MLLLCYTVTLLCSNCQKVIVVGRQSCYWVEICQERQILKLSSVQDDLWYLKPDEALDPLCGGADTLSLASTVSMVGDQQLMFNINQLIVTVEAGLGNNTIPMILLESKLSGEVRNWASRLSVLASTQVEMAYYNSKFALWEPVIEPIGRKIINLFHSLRLQSVSRLFDKHGQDAV